MEPTLTFTITLKGLGHAQLARLLEAMEDADGGHVLDDVVITPEINL